MLRVERSTYFGPELPPSSLLQDADHVAKILLNVEISFESASTSSVRSHLLEILDSLEWAIKSRPLESIPFRTSAVSSNRSALQCQFGNIANAFYDLMKLQLVFSKGLATGCILIVPMRRTAKQINSNVANYETILSNLDAGFSSFITAPLVLMGIESGSDDL